MIIWWSLTTLVFFYVYQKSKMTISAGQYLKKDPLGKKFKKSFSMEPLNHLKKNFAGIFLRCEYFIFVIFIFRLKRPRSCPSNGSRIDKDSNKFRRSPYRLAGYTSYSKIRLDLKTMIVNSKYIMFSLTLWEEI